jgi:cobalt/nickel transport protein
MRWFWTVLLLTIGLAAVAQAHFGMIIPSDEILTPGEKPTIKLNVMFAHPFEGGVMDMDRPEEFGVLFGSKKIPLLSKLKPVKVKGYQDDKPHQAWFLEYRLRRPGDYIFYLVPKPYWEPAEDKFIVHYTKVIVDAFGKEEGWDEEVGLKTEIIPLTRPYGLYAGNLFQGLVKVDGKPAPFTEVEVEYYNEDGKVKAPAPPFVTQVIKCDSNGIFTYAIPKAGWWGFAALSEDTKKLVKDGKEKPVEIGAVIWVRAYEMR